MRIFTAVRHSANPRFFYGGLWSENFHPPLRALGHEVIESRQDLLAASRFMHIAGGFTPEEMAVRKRITEQILEEVREAQRQKPLDLFLSYFYNAHFDPSGFSQVHQWGIPTVNFYCNSISQFELVADLAPKVKFSWHPEKNARERYLRVGANPIWVQMGANPALCHPVSGITRQPKVCFVGQRYGDRDRLLSALIEGAVPLDVFGRGWGAPRTDEGPEGGFGDRDRKYLGRTIREPGGWRSYAALAWRNIREQGLLLGSQRNVRQWRYAVEGRRLREKVASVAMGFAEHISATYAAYEVVVNFSNIWEDGRPGSRLIPHVRLRDFEGPMCRTCFLTGYTEEIEEFFDIGKEIDAYHGTEDLVEKSRYYLAHPDHAARLREAGYERAMRDHTWEKRFKTLFAMIGLKG